MKKLFCQMKKNVKFVKMKIIQFTVDSVIILMITFISLKNL